ncbi:uncharacterized protein LOC142357050 isoform X3 [Convolutriloba macropyga]|uniref:uncharacterized protein LOC142357050 isoform X3 n=1 Tax=Convolutriloba macropyga TaxID=536237 RepID=UPI003F523DF7
MAGGQTQLGVTCVECPELRSLVGVLEEHIDPDQLVPGDECLEHDEAVLACRRERLRFLQKTALLSDIESILDDFSLSGSETSWDMHGSEGALMTCRPNVYSAMHKAFVGARASQQLFTPQLQNLSLEPSILVDSSTVNIFGLSPTDLQNNTQQQVHIIPELELRLACHQSWLSEALGDATGGMVICCIATEYVNMTTYWKTDCIYIYIYILNHMTQNHVSASQDVTPLMSISVKASQLRKL